MPPTHGVTETGGTFILSTPAVELGFSRKNGALNLLRPAGVAENWAHRPGMPSSPVTTMASTSIMVWRPLPSVGGWESRG